MSPQKPWVWLDMKRNQSKMVCFDNTPAEPSHGALYSVWKPDEPSNDKNEDCAYLEFGSKKWNDNKCDFGQGAGPLVLCQRERKKHG